MGRGDATTGAGAALGAGDGGAGGALRVGATDDDFAPAWRDVSTHMVNSANTWAMRALSAWS